MIHRRLLSLGVMVILPAACSILPGGDIADLFYRVQLLGPQPTSVCMDLASELTSKMPLHVIYNEVGPREKCMVQLGDQEHAGLVATTIDWNPEIRSLVIRQSEFSRSGKRTAGTQEVASQIIAVVQAKFPDAVITRFTPKYSLLGP